MPSTRASRSSTTSSPRNSCTRTGGSPACCSRRCKAERGADGRRNLVPTGEPDMRMECDDVLIAVGQENAFPWIERDIGIDFDQWGMPVVDKVTFQSSLPNVFFGGDSAFGPKNIIWAVAHGHDAAISIDLLLRGEDVRKRPPPTDQSRQPEDGHPRMELRQRRRARPALQGAAQGPGDRAQGHQAGGRARLRPEARFRGGATLPQLRRSDGILRPVMHRMRRLRRHLPDGLHHLHR